MQGLCWKSRLSGALGIESMIRMKIGPKLLLTYCILLITVFLVTGITFKILLQRYLVNEARSLLRTEALAVAETLGKTPVLERDIGPNLIAKKELRIAGRFIDSKIIVLSKDRRILFTNLTGADKKVLQTLAINGELKSKEYVSEKVPIYSKKGEMKGYIFLFTQVEELNQISRLMNKTQLMSLIIGGVFAVILMLFFQRGLTKPIQELKQHMTHFSFSGDSHKPMIHTRDEIEELAECFNDLAQKLRNYDVQQKRFLQNTSHELKTPLMSIQGYAEAIKDGVVEGPEMLESLDVIIDESKRLKKIVEEMVYLIKLDNVEETFDFQEACLGDIIAQSVKSVKALADAKGIYIKVNGDQSLKGSFDSEKLIRAFINILSNGVRYAESEIQIDCSIGSHDIEIIIRDDGKGFAEGEEKKVFERFYKGEKGITGIGLAITKAIVEGHNGKIEAYNSSSKGAIFKIVLPQH